MRISDIAIKRAGSDRVILSSIVGDDVLWFDLPEVFSNDPGIVDSFFIMALASSMLRNEPLVVDEHLAVSKTLFENVGVVQKIFNCWNPRLSIVDVRARVADRSSSRSNGRTATMFSGGVDSLDTLLSHLSSRPDAVFVGGFDFQARGDAYDVAENRCRELTQVLDVPLVVVRTNQKAWGRRSGVARDFWFGGYLAASSLFFSYRKVLIPSSHTYSELDPNGSHLILDRLWSNGVTEFVYSDAENARTEKIRRITEFPELLQRLHVCWRDPFANCGKCGKCLRTMTTLSILGVHGPFPRMLSARDVGKISLRTCHDLQFAIDNIMLAHSLGREDLVRSLKKSIRRYDFLDSTRALERAFIGPFLRRLRKKYFPYRQNVGFSNRRPDLDI